MPAAITAASPDPAVRRPRAARLPALIAALLLPLLAACTAGSGPFAPGAGYDGTIEGTVTYAEPAALSPDAVLEVALFDMSRPNPTQRPVAKSIYGDLGEGPIVFAFDYDPTVIDRDHTYVLVARILENGRAVFLTRDQKRVLTQGAGDTVRLDLVRRPGA
jgi:uncharacterized lipoprotein YbaY